MKLSNLVLSFVTVLGLFPAAANAQKVVLPVGSAVYYVSPENVTVTGISDVNVSKEELQLQVAARLYATLASSGLTLVDEMPVNPKGVRVIKMTLAAGHSLASQSNGGSTESSSRDSGYYRYYDSGSAHRSTDSSDRSSSENCYDFTVSVRVVDAVTKVATGASVPKNWSARRADKVANSSSSSDYHRFYHWESGGRTSGYQTSQAPDERARFVIEQLQLEAGAQLSRLLRAEQFANGTLPASATEFALSDGNREAVGKFGAAEVGDTLYLMFANSNRELKSYSAKVKKSKDGMSIITFDLPVREGFTYTGEYKNFGS